MKAILKLNLGWRWCESSATCFLIVLLSLGSGCESSSVRTPGASPARQAKSRTVALPDVFDQLGQPANPFAQSQARGLIFIFVRTDCPISNRYAPEIQKLYEKYSPRNFAFWLVYPDAETTAEDIANHTKSFNLSLPILKDPRHVLAKRADIKVTPEAALFSPDGRELYHGRIDDRYADFGKERPTPSRRDLEAAITEVLAGKPVANPRTLAIGCYLSDLP